MMRNKYTTPQREAGHGMKFPPAGLSVQEYIARFSRMNGLMPSTFLIGRTKVTA